MHGLARELDAELVAMGSAGVKVMSVVRDVTDAYVHAGGQYEWDSAAPVAVARAAGLFTSRIDGSPLRYNQDDVYLPDLVVCRPELADRILAWVARQRRRVTMTIRHVLLDADGVLQDLPGGWIESGAALPRRPRRGVHARLVERGGCPCCAVTVTSSRSSPRHVESFGVTCLGRRPVRRRLAARSRLVP